MRLGCVPPPRWWSVAFPFPGVLGIGYLWAWSVFVFRCAALLFAVIWWDHRVGSVRCSVATVTYPGVVVRWWEVFRLRRGDSILHRFPGGIAVLIVFVARCTLIVEFRFPILRVSLAPRLS